MGKKRLWSVMLLSQAIEALLLATRADGRSPRTVYAYSEKLKPLLRALGDVPVEAITTADLRRYVAGMMGQTTIYNDHPTRPAESRMGEWTQASRRAGGPGSVVRPRRRSSSSPIASAS